MFKKYSRSTKEIKKVQQSEVSSMMADQTIVDRLTKVAEGVKKISQKSDDFLYFSIIFLKAAESAALDDNGLPKKLASGETAWCYFDDNHRWHGNVEPHRNNNHDIFPESELKKAASKWIGMPLCKDHKSDSVDGIRGIILDTHYDEKFKQVVGLCALDRVNYPDLARKVETGMVRYGSMGTAVEKSICSTCGNVATTPDKYCDHVKQRSCHGEINVGLNPIEYSLVVQPAEPQAILLKCIASLQNYKSEFKKYVSDVDEMLGKLSSAQAQHLDKIMKTACGDDGCSIEKRDRIVKSFFENNKSLTKSSGFDSDYILDADKVRNLTTSAQTAADMGDQELANKILEIVNSYVTDGYKPSGSELEESFSEASGISNTSQMQNSMNNSNIEEEPILKDRPNTYEDVKTSTASLTSQTKKSIKNILEEFMDQSRLKKRAEMRRKLAYMQGGSEGREPAGFKEEKFSYDHDKHMKQTGSMGSESGSFPGDEAVKQKLSRAQLKQRQMRRLAYMQGGSEGREPAGFKEEKFSYDHDKHMHQTKSDFNEDKAIKENLKRANYYRGLTKRSKYAGPSLRTAIKVANSKENSKLQVYAGKDLIMSIPAYEIFGNEVHQNWSWLKSAQYGKEVCKLVRAHGVLQATNILKEAQEAPPADPMAEDPMAADPMAADPMAADPMAEDPMAAEPAAEDPMAAEPMAEEPSLEEDQDPVTEAETKLSKIEDLVGEIRDLVSKIQDEKMADVDVHIDVGGKKGEAESGEAEELEALASEVIGQLKKAAVSLDSSADEMAMISETYENIAKISSSDRIRFVKLAKAAYSDSDEAYGEAKATIKIAKSILRAMRERRFSSRRRLASRKNTHSLKNKVKTASQKLAEQQGQEELVAEAVLLRRNRREAILKTAENRIRTSMKKRAELQKKQAKRKKEAVKVASEKVTANDSMSRIKEKLADSLSTVSKKEAEGNFKIKLRRAYDIALDMQKKGLISHTKTALDKQVDEILNFDDKAFESFKRSIANLKPVSSVKTASNIGSLNVGVQEESISTKSTKDISKNLLAAMWDK